MHGRITLTKSFDMTWDVLAEGATVEDRVTHLERRSALLQTKLQITELTLADEAANSQKAHAELQDHLLRVDAENVNRASQAMSAGLRLQVWGATCAILGTVIAAFAAHPTTQVRNPSGS
jgi:hypothetical protein